MGQFHNCQPTQMGSVGYATQENTYVYYNPSEVIIKVKNDNKYNIREHYDHHIGNLAGSYKQIEPGREKVEVDVIYGKHPAPPPLPREEHPEEHRKAFLYSQVPSVPRAASPAAGAQGVSSGDDTIGRTAMELNKVRDVTELNFKPDENGTYRANVQGVFKNGFAKVFKEDPAFAQKLLGSDAVTLSEDRESIVLRRPMSADEIKTFQDNAAAIGKLKRGDLRRAHEIYDLESHSQPQGSSQSQGNGSLPANPSQGAGAQAGQGSGASVASRQEEANVLAAAQRDAAAAHTEAQRADQARQRAEAAAARAMGQTASDTHNTAHFSPQDKIAIAQVILAKLGHDLGPKGNDGLMGHHDPKGGFTGRALEAFKKEDVGYSPPANAVLDDKTFERLIQRYQGLQQGKDGISPTGVLDKNTVDHLKADQSALAAKGVKVSHAIPESAAAPTTVAQDRTTPDLAALEAKVELLTKRYGAPSASATSAEADHHIVPPSQTPVTRSAPAGRFV